LAPFNRRDQGRRRKPHAHIKGVVRVLAEVDLQVVNERVEPLPQVHHPPAVVQPEVKVLRDEGSEEASHQRQGLVVLGDAPDLIVMGVHHNPLVTDDGGPPLALVGTQLLIGRQVHHIVSGAEDHDRARLDANPRALHRLVGVERDVFAELEPLLMAEHHQISARIIDTEVRPDQLEDLPLEKEQLRRSQWRGHDDGVLPRAARAKEKPGAPLKHRADLVTSTP